MTNVKQFLLALGVTATAGLEVLGAGPAGLDRPTPPACCADGICYPKPSTFGVYTTRWRRWPTESLEPTPAGAKPPGAELGPDLRPFDRPGKEEEDRAAPPPTKAAEEAREEEEGSSRGSAQQEMPFVPTPGNETPPTTPPGPSEPSTPPGMTFPWENEEPATPPTTAPPTGDLDPPPSPRFGTPAVVENRPLRGTHQPPATVPARRVLPRRIAPTDDPPPAFPLAMANAR